jgi:hypothetical protein
MTAETPLSASGAVPAGTAADPISFGPLRLYRDGEQLVVARRQGHDWQRTAVAWADAGFVLRIDHQDGDERRWAVELRSTLPDHPPLHLFFYREREPYGLPSGIRAWAERLSMAVVADQADLR